MIEPQDSTDARGLNVREFNVTNNVFIEREVVIPYTDEPFHEDPNTLVIPGCTYLTGQHLFAQLTGNTPANIDLVLENSPHPCGLHLWDNGTDVRVFK